MLRQFYSPGRGQGTCANERYILGNCGLTLRDDIPKFMRIYLRPMSIMNVCVRHDIEVAI